MSTTPNKNNSKPQEKETTRMSVDEALETLNEVKEFLLKAANSETVIDGDFAVKAIRSIERIQGYINWARSILKQRFSNPSFNRSYMQSFKSYKKAYYPKKTYSKPYSRRYFKGGKRSWRRRY